MNTSRKAIVKLLATIAILVALPVAPLSGVAQSAPEFAGSNAILDSVSFGDSTSESAHSFTGDASNVIVGGLGQSARVLLPNTPPSWTGGAATFILKVDPVKLNYVTFKFWGSDKGEAAGRLLLFSGDMEIGYRDQGDYDVVNQIEDLPIYPGRFVYTTLPLPPSLTNGKTSLSLTIRPIGWLYQYGGSFDQRQKPFNVPSRGIYAAYTTTSPYFDPPASEVQGTIPPVTVRPERGPDFMDKVRAHVNDYVTKSAAHPAKIDQALPHGYGGTIILLATAYQAKWTSVYHDPHALETIALDGDAYAIQQSKDPKFVGSDWPGAGPLGWGLMRVYPDLQAAGLLDQPIALADGKTEPRRQAWADTLEASVDFWQAHRRSYTNQSMIVDTNIFTANEGLRLLAPSRALPEETVLNYLYQSIGIAPWTGSVTNGSSGGGTDIPAGAYSEKPYGDGYYDMTSKGLSRELGYVAGYGETILHFVSDMYRLTDDPRIRDQMVKMAIARSYFRYPLPDQDGNKAMVLEAITDNRNGHYPADVAYGAHHGSRESEPMEVAALTKDPTVVGMAQQELADNQYFTHLDSHMKTSDANQVYGLLTAVDDYPIVAALPQTGYKMPMSDGHPDFVWSDEDDAVVVVKHGERRMYFNFYYRAERAINGVVRIHDMTPSIERIVTAHSNYEFTPSGHEYVRPDWTDGMRGVGFPPPGETVHQAWAGEKMPIEKRPDDAAVPAYGDWGPFLGRADFYSLDYGDYVIGLNTNASKPYRLAIPTGAKTAINLATGKTISTAGPITVAPKTTVVLYLGR